MFRLENLLIFGYDNNVVHPIIYCSLLYNERNIFLFPSFYVHLNVYVCLALFVEIILQYLCYTLIIGFTSSMFYALRYSQEFKRNAFLKSVLYDDLNMNSHDICFLCL